jgi:multiple sugar transport system ATP-binding protein
MATVKLDHLRKVFGANSVAVEDLVLDIEDKEFITLLGPSGCGKTTTLRMIAGLETPTSGRILFDSQAVNELPPAKRNVAMVFQSYALYPHMTVRENMEYPLKKRKTPRAERSAKVKQTAELLQIEELLDRKPRQLSGGQQQRVALGRAIIRDPTVFLLDEPLSNLDAKLRSYMRAELIQLHRRIGKTMIYVTHDQLEAMTMSNRIAVFNHGRLQQVASPDEIYNRPANRFVASFIGTPSMNFFEGDVVSEADQPIFRTSTLRIPLARFPEVKPGRSVIAGVRPEDVLVGDATGLNEAEVSIVEPTGHESIVFLTAGIDKFVARVGNEMSVNALSRIKVGFRAAKVLLFDSETEERLSDVR